MKVGEDYITVVIVGGTMDGCHEVDSSDAITFLQDAVNGGATAYATYSIYKEWSEISRGYLKGSKYMISGGRGKENYKVSSSKKNVGTLNNEFYA